MNSITSLELSMFLLVICSTFTRLNTGISGALCVQDNGLPPGTNRSQLEKELFNQYDSELHPSSGVTPVEVFVKIIIMSLTNFDETNMVFTLKIDLHQEWVDPRLTHSVTNGTFKLTGTKVDKIWRPSTDIINAKDRASSEQMKYALIDYNGTVHFGQIQTIEVTCEMDFHKYPLDKQICPLKMSSYGSTNSEVLYRWMKDEPVTLSNDVTAGLEIKEASAEKPGQTKSPTGTFSVLEVKLHLHRHINFFVIQIYLPTILLSIVSWMVFWFPRKSISERAIVVLIAALTMIVMFGFSNNNGPKVNYIKSVDVFVLTSLCQIYLVLVVCLIIYYTHLNEEEKQKQHQKKKTMDLEEQDGNDTEISVITGRHPLPNSDDYDLYLRAMKLQFANPGERGLDINKDRTSQDLTQPRKRDKNQKKIKNRMIKIKENPTHNSEEIDKWMPSQILQCCARVVFPLFYVAFNIYYWITAAAET